MVVYIRDARKQGLQIVGSATHQSENIKVGDRVNYPIVGACVITRVSRFKDEESTATATVDARCALGAR